MPQTFPQISEGAEQARPAATLPPAMAAGPASLGLGRPVVPEAAAGLLAGASMKSLSDALSERLEGQAGDSEAPAPAYTGNDAPVGSPALLQQFLDRDHCILAFNERVMDWAVREDVPLLERLRYLCIVSSNLDEWFEVRCAPHVTAAKAGDAKGLYTLQSFRSLMDKAHGLVARQYALYNQSLMPAFAEKGIRVVSHGERSSAQRKWVSEYFFREVQPLLMPVGLDPSHPFPQVANKALNFIVRLKGVDAFGRANEVAIVKVQIGRAHV